MKRIKLTQGQETLVDDEDFEFLSQWKWAAQYCADTDSYYAQRHAYYPGGKGKGYVVTMSRLLLDAPKGMKVDHKDRNTLNNQKSNLRLCTSAQNSHNREKQKNNTSGYKGVFKNGSGWIARMGYKGKTLSFGTYKTPLEAHLAYMDASKQLHGEFSIAYSKDLDE